MQAFTYRNLVNRLSDFDRWLTSLGLVPRNDDRIHQAINALRIADAATQKGHTTGECYRIQPEHWFQLIEALEAHDVYLAFQSERSDQLKQTLKRALSGPVHAMDERLGTSTDGRNIWFELALAAEWKLLGVKVRLGEPDL